MSPRRFLAAALFPLALALAATAAPKWSTLQAPHCLIVSQCSERETCEWANDFEQFVASLRTRLNIEEAHLTPLTVVLFSSPERFAAYHPVLADGRRNKGGGYCISLDSWSAIGLGKRFQDDEETRRIILHETTHWLTAAARTRLPPWINEGFAESFSTFRVEKSGAVAGEPILPHVALLRQATWVPLAKLMLTRQGDKLYTDTERKRLFYAQSWLFVHRLLFQPESHGIEQLNRFFAARLRGADQFTAFKLAFGEDMAAVEQACRDYAFGGAVRFLRFPVPAEAAVTAPFTPAAPYTVEIALARLAVGSRNEALARQHTSRALTLDPAAPAAYELVACLENSRGQHEAAAAAARQALERGSRDALMHLVVAHALIRHHNNRGTPAEGAREIADHLARAIALQPKLRSAYVTLASVARALPAATVADAQLLVDGFKLFPDAPELLIGLAALVHKDGNDTRAFELLDLALGHDDLIDDKERATAERLRTEWKVEPLRKQVNELRKQRRFRDALAVCETLLQEPMQQTMRQFWENRRDELRFDAAVEAARAAEKAGDPAEALRQFEALAGQPDLDERQTRKVREHLERIRLSHPNLQNPVSPAP